MNEKYKGFVFVKFWMCLSKIWLNHLDLRQISFCQTIWKLVIFLICDPWN